MENKKVDISVEDKVIVMKTDLDQDGKESSKMKLFMNEAIQEIFAKGVKKEDVKIVDFELSPMGLVLKLDTDKDGQNLLEYSISFGEIFGEALSLVKKD